MKLISRITQHWLRYGTPMLWGALSRVAYGDRNIRFGRSLRCDGLPRCLVDPGSQLVIGNNVEIRSGVEIRVHGAAQVVIEDGVRIDRGVRILAANSAVVRICTGARIGLYSVLNGGTSITVGSKCLISGFVYLQTSMHRFSSREVAIRDQGYDHGPITIGTGAWLGAHVVVMPGLTIGADAIVGSNAVVTRDVPVAMMVAGVPARPLYERNSAENS